MSAPLVKICGLTDPRQAVACAELGAWAIGVVLSDESPRGVTPAVAGAVVGSLPPSVARVGVVVDPEAEAAGEPVAEAGLTHLQVHGDSDAVAIRQNAGVPVIEAFRIAAVGDLADARRSEADLVLLDASVRGLHGGTGRSFDWRLLERTPMDRPYVLAGGLSPQNVAEAVRRGRPSHVDVSSGVESAPGEKDLSSVRAFIEASTGRAAA
ncbi:MAG: phosphoribosylanthranilate isomerase [Miltoncostaeaceae bacterium]